MSVERQATDRAAKLGHYPEPVIGGDDHESLIVHVDFGKTQDLGVLLIGELQRLPCSTAIARDP